MVVSLVGFSLLRCRGTDAMASVDFVSAYCNFAVRVVVAMFLGVFMTWD